MIHNMMDPAFLVPQQADRGADYKLWPTSLNVKATAGSRGTDGGGVGGGGSAAMQQASSSFNPPGANLQGLWSTAGPSPLEKLLEQQKRRQVDN